jgi:hypothetical protein
MDRLTKAAPVPDRKAWFFARLGLTGLCAIDAALQAFWWLGPNAFAGLGVLAVPLAPLIAAYYLVMLVATLAGLPLAIACFFTRRPVLMAMGVVVLFLTAMNVQGIAAWQARSAAESREQHRELDERAAFLARCVPAVDRALDAVRADLDVPRRAAGLAPPGGVILDNGLRIDPPAAVDARAFEAFYYERLAGAEVRVVLRDVSQWDRQQRCDDLDPSTGVVKVKRVVGDLYLDGTRVDGASRDLLATFPAAPAHPAPPGERVVVTRYVDPESGNRTYATGTAPPGTTREGSSFAVRRTAFAGSKPLRVCNAPFRRPESPEHFLSTDEACEGYQPVALLGFVGTTRTADTPRALVRCLRTVQAPLLTNRRHLSTTDVGECRDGIVEAVTGFTG